MRINYLLVLILSLATATTSFASLDDVLYCGKYNDRYREIRYWARAVVSIDDYDSGSGDALALKLVDGRGSLGMYEQNGEIVDHFQREFQRVIKGRLPLHDVNLGADMRLSEFMKKNTGSDAFEMFQAYEEARMRSLYGKNPAAIYCNIAVSRTDFPVLYEIKTTIVASDDLINYGTSEVKEESIGYSAPAYIKGELKRKITEHLEKIAEKMGKIRACNKK